MTTVIIIFLGILFGLGVGWAFMRGSKKDEVATKDDRAMELLLAQVNELSRTVDRKLSDSNKEVNEAIRHQSTQSQNIIRDITERLTRLDETNKQVMSFTDQLQSLQDILKNPKQRGVLGEYYLETLLKNVMPPGSYQMQFPFNDGTIVDAAVFVKDKVIPIDSKFSLENYNRITETRDPVEKERFEKIFLNDLKDRIVETSKYIQPENGT